MSYAFPSTHPAYFNELLFVTQGWDQTTHGVALDRVDGWMDQAEIRQTAEPNPGRDGERPGESHAGGRTITLYGVVDGADAAELEEHKATLRAVFAPSSEERVFKLPLPDAVAPSFTYADAMTGFERVLARIVDGPVFGGNKGPCAQEWSLSLRASDPLVYSDVESIDGHDAVLDRSPVPTPMKVEAELGTGAVTANTLLRGSLATGYETLLRMSSVSAWDAAITAYTTPHEVVVDAVEREAYFLLPQNAARVELYDPVWFYRLNETSGTTADNSEGTAAYDGTYAGTPTLNQTGPFADSKSILLNGSNHVTRAYAAALFPAEWTFEAYYKGDGGYIADYTGESTSRGFRILQNAFGLLLEMGDGTSLVPIVETYTPPTVWHHVALTYKDGLACLYLDGDRVAAVPITYVAPTSGTMYLGRFFAGNLSSAGMHDVAYPASVIEDLFNGGAAQSIGKYRAGVYITAVPTWPHIDASDAVVTGTGNFSAGIVGSYRAARR